MILHRVGAVFAVPLRCVGVLLELQHVTVRRCAVRHPVEAPRLGEGVGFQPATDLEGVRSGLISDVAERTAALDAVFGRPEAERTRRGDYAAVLVQRPRRGRRIGRDPRSLALVVVIIAGRDHRQFGRQVRVQRDPAEIIAPHAAGIEIGVVDRTEPAREGRADTRPRCDKADRRAVVRPGVGGERRLILVGLADLQRERVIVGDVIVAQAATTDDVVAEILIILLAAIGEVQESRKAAERAQILDDLAVRLMLALDAVALPLVGGEVAIAQIPLQPAAEIAAVDPGIAAIGIVRAIGAAAGHVQHVARLVAEELDRPAEIAGRGGAERAGALRDFGAGDVLGDDRAADVQAVDVAIAHVAERHAVEREAELVLVEPA